MTQIIKEERTTRWYYYHPGPIICSQLRQNLFKMARQQNIQDVYFTNIRAQTTATQLMIGRAIISMHLFVNAFLEKFDINMTNYCAVFILHGLHRSYRMQHIFVATINY